MPDYQTKTVSTIDILHCIDQVKNDYTEQLRGELSLASSYEALSFVGGKTEAANELMQKLYDRISKLIVA